MYYSSYPNQHMTYQSPHQYNVPSWSQWPPRPLQGFQWPQGWSGQSSNSQQCQPQMSQPLQFPQQQQ